MSPTDKTYRERLSAAPYFGEAYNIASEADAEIASLRARIAELEADAQRLDWCEMNLATVSQDMAESVCLTYIDADGEERPTKRFANLRAAIDAALNSKKE